MSAEQVYLGIPSVIPPSDLYQLRSIYFPLGKIGGKPSWLDPVKVPTADDLKCETCGKSMVFVIQIYAPDAKGPPSSFHRYLYVFVCRNGECSKPNESANMKVIRMQLPRKNPYYTSEKPLDPHLDGNVDDPYYNVDTYARLCNTCGVKSTEKCGKCQQVWYCSKDHQQIDWKSGHKKKCGNASNNETSESNDVDDSKAFSTPYKSTTKLLNSFVFREYGLQLVTDYISKVDLADIPEKPEQDEEVSDEEESDEEDQEESEEFQRNQQAELAKIREKMRTDGISEDNSNADVLDTLERERRDRYFRRFMRIVARQSNQILRYARHSNPLRPSDHTPLPSTIPPCQLCRGDRTFELQLMPNLLSLMEVDDLKSSIDWATVCIYTCKASCDLKERGFTPEHLVKLDFISTTSADERNKN